MPALRPPPRAADLSRPATAEEAVVESTEAGRRLDLWLAAKFPWRSRTQFARLLDAGHVRLAGRPAKPSTRVKAGDRVVVDPDPDPTAPEHEAGDDLVVVHEDPWIVVVDKPSGMAAHPVGRIRHGTLVNKLHGRYRRDDPGEDRVPRLAHRLDLDTSGLVLAVLDERADAAVARLFRERIARKTYLALVAGVPARPAGEIDAPIGRRDDGETGVEMAVRPDGQPARTTWRVREAFARHALLELDLHTGRTHQLRVHLAHLGHPIVGDHLYGDCRPLLASMADPSVPFEHEAWLLERLALHAWRLSFPHPHTGVRLDLESPLPPAFEAALAALRALHAAERARS